MIVVEITDSQSFSKIDHYLSNVPFTTLGSDTPPHTTYLPFVEETPVFENRLFNRETGVFGISLVPWGLVRVSRNYSGISTIQPGHFIRIYEGNTKYRKDFDLVFNGRIETINRNFDHWSIKLIQYDLSAKISDERYGGTNTDTNGTDGHPDDTIVNQRKPRCLGWVFPKEGIIPVCVNKPGEIYQVEGYRPVVGSWELFEELEDGTIVTGWSFAGNRNSVTFNSSLPSTLEYTTCNEKGMFRLGSIPVGTIKVKLIGASGYPGTISNRWTHPRIIEDLFEELGLDVNIGTNFSDDEYKAGYYDSNPETSLFEFLGEILPGTGSYIFDDDGILGIEHWNTGHEDFQILEPVRLGKPSISDLQKINQLGVSYCTFNIPELPNITGVGQVVEGNSPTDRLKSRKLFNIKNNPSEFDRDDIIREDDDNSNLMDTGILVSVYDNMINGESGGVIKSHYMEKSGPEEVLDRIFDVVKLGGIYVKIQYMSRIIPDINSGITIDGLGNFVLTGRQQLRRKINNLYLRSL